MWRAITATRFSLKLHSMLTLREKWANHLGTSTWRVNSPKITNLWTLPPHCLQLRTTWNFGQNLWQDYVHKNRSSADYMKFGTELMTGLCSYMHVGLHVKYVLFLSNFNQTWIFCASLLMCTLFSLGGLPAHPQNPHSWRTSLSLLVWPLSYGLSGLGGHTRSIKFPP